MAAPLIASAIAALLRKYIARALVWARSKLTILFTNLLTFLLTVGKDWLESMTTQARTLILNKDDPNDQDLARFIAIATGREASISAEMDRRINEAGDKARDIRDEYLAHYDTYSRNLERRYPVLFNEAFRLKLRDRLTAAINRQIDSAMQRAIQQSALTAQKIAAAREKLVEKAGEKVQEANAIRALRSPRLKGRSDTQVAGYLRTLKDGTATHPYSLEELENEIKGRKAQGKWNPH